MEDYHKITSLLGELTELNAQLDSARIKMQQMIDAVLTSEQKMAINDIKEEFEPVIESAHARIRAQEAEIREFVCQHGKTVKGDKIQAVYVKPRVSWDTDALDAIAASEEFAWLQRFRKEGKASVSIRNA